MKTHKGCTYWYEVSMYVDKEGDGYLSPALLRIPVRCEESGVHTSKCTYLDPSSAQYKQKIFRTKNYSIRRFHLPQHSYRKNGQEKSWTSLQKSVVGISKNLSAGRKLPTLQNGMQQ